MEWAKAVQSQPRRAEEKHKANPSERQVANPSEKQVASPVVKHGVEPVESRAASTQLQQWVGTCRRCRFLRVAC